LHQSQLVGYPDLPQFGVSWQYPSVSMMDWRDGSPTAKFWALKLLREEIPVDGNNQGPMQIVPIPDGVRNAGLQVINDEAIFVCWVNDTSTQPPTSKVFLINTKNSQQSLNLPGAAGKVARFVDEFTEDQPAATTTLTDDIIILNRFAIMVVHYQDLDEDDVIITAADHKDENTSGMVQPRIILEED